MQHHKMQVGVGKICAASQLTSAQFETVSKTVESDRPTKASTSKNQHYPAGNTITANRTHCHSDGEHMSILQRVHHIFTTQYRVSSRRAVTVHTRVICSV